MILSKRNNQGRYKMLFRLDYAISVENVKSANERFATMEEKRDGLTVIGI